MMIRRRCQCLCSEITNPGAKWIRGHGAIMKGPDCLFVKIKRRCACGCGGITSPGHKWISGHGRKKKLNPNFKHGSRGSYIYGAWANMKRRCYTKSVPVYKYYGGRGIRICIRWRLSFKAFRKDMGRRPSSKHTLERIDNNGDYTPENCCWATMKEQANNRRNSVMLTHKGHTLNLTAWARKLEVNVVTLHKRYHAGWPVEKILSRKNFKTKTRERIIRPS